MIRLGLVTARSTFFLPSSSEKFFRSSLGMYQHVFFDPDKQVAFRKTSLNRSLQHVLRYAFSIKSLFEMQALMLHHFESGDKRCLSFNDMILCAPTGSGKTLAYALPIVQSILQRYDEQRRNEFGDSEPVSKSSLAQPRIRAVIVVPTRDLAQQVAHVFRTLFISMKIAQINLNETETDNDDEVEDDQSEDSGDTNDSDDKDSNSDSDNGCANGEANDTDAYEEGTKSYVALVTGASSVAKEARSLQCPNCEVIVATPGRLVHHVQHTSGVKESLSYVRYFVLDESDRLLHESYDQWLSSVTTHVGQTPSSSLQLELSNPYDSYRPSSGLFSLSVVPAVASAAGSVFKSALSDTRVRKILVSATQSHNPMHLVHLDMRYPTIFRTRTSSVIQKDSVTNEEEPLRVKHDHEEDRYTVPSTLKETGHVIKNIEQKPAALLRLLGWTKDMCESEHGKPRKHMRSNSENELKHEREPDEGVNGVKLVFTNSINSAHRLCRLLELCTYALYRNNRIPVFEMSAELSAERRQHVVSMLKEHQVDDRDQPDNPAPVIVCSDVLSRGMDIFTVDHVINYDAPAHVRTYLHRAGRTARAGRNGVVSTLLLAKQAHHFRRMVYDADRANRTVQISNMRTEQFLIPTIHDMFNLTLTALKRVLNREKLNLLSKELPLPLYSLYELEKRSQDDQIANENEPTGHEPDRPNGHGDIINEQGDDNRTYALNKRDRHWDGSTEYEDEHYHGHSSEEMYVETHEVFTDDDDGWERFDIERGVYGISNLMYAQIAKNLLAS